MKTPVNLCLLLKKQRKNANITATVIEIIAITNFHKVETPSEWSKSIKVPMPINVKMENTDTKETIALGKHCTTAEYRIPIARDIMTLSLMES